MRTALKSTPISFPEDTESVLDGPVALFLDFDGTLVEFAETPGAVLVDASVTSLLVDLYVALDGALALVSGRSIASLHSVLAPTVVPMAGQHGLEIYRPGRSILDLACLPEDWTLVVERLERFVSGRPGLLLEHKGLACALHYRRRPELESEVLQATEHLIDSLNSDIVMQRGKSVVEVRAAGANKGVALQWFMTREPFAGRYPVFIGDDDTDEDGFRAAKNMGGLGIHVGQSRSTEANLRLDNVAATKQWLSELARQNVERRNVNSTL